MYFLKGPDQCIQCFIVYAVWHAWHIGYCSSLSKSECVILVWPMRSLDNTTSSFWLFLKFCFYSPNIGLISRSLIYLLLLQWCCLWCCIHLFIFIYKYVYRILKFISGSILKADLAALLTYLFLLILVWRGIQQRNILLSSDIFFEFTHEFFISSISNNSV